VPQCPIAGDATDNIEDVGLDSVSETILNNASVDSSALCRRLDLSSAT